MRVTTIATLSAAGAGASVTTQSGGLLPGETVPVLLSSPSGAFVGSAQVQTSVDGTTWTNAGTAVTTAGADIQAIKLENFIRLNCTAYTSGNVKALALGDLG